MSEENIFGKIRGRFDEGAARSADRTLRVAAMAAICAMPQDEFDLFVEQFNETMAFRVSPVQIVKAQK